MGVALELYEQLTDAGEDRARAPLIAEAFEALESRKSKCGSPRRSTGRRCGWCDRDPEADLAEGMRQLLTRPPAECAANDPRDERISGILCVRHMMPIRSM